MRRRHYVAFILWGLLISNAAFAELIDETNILPLSMTTGIGVVPSKEIGDTKFGYSRFVEVGTLYRVHENFGMGVGFNLMSRNFTYQGKEDEYSIDTLFTQFQWHPRYDRQAWGYYLGLKANIHVILFGEIGGLDSDDKDAVTLGVEPLAGLLIPFLYPHLFLDLSLSYQIRQFPSLYHQPASSRQREVDDSQFLFQFRVRF